MLPYQEGGRAGRSGDPAELCTSDVWDGGDGAWLDGELYGCSIVGDMSGVT